MSNSPESQELQSLHKLVFDNLINPTANAGDVLDECLSQARELSRLIGSHAILVDHNQDYAVAEMKGIDAAAHLVTGYAAIAKALIDRQRQQGRAEA
jgi:hypothetical protein